MRAAAGGGGGGVLVFVSLLPQCPKRLWAPENIPAGPAPWPDDVNIMINQPALPPRFLDIPLKNALAPGRTIQKLIPRQPNIITHDCPG